MIVIREKEDFYNNLNYFTITFILFIIITIIVNIIIFAWKKGWIISHFIIIRNINLYEAPVDFLPGDSSSATDYCLE